MNAHTIIDALRKWSVERPERLAVRYDDAAAGAIAQLTYGELEDRVRQAATVLAGAAPEGSRVALMLPNGVEYIVAFLAAQLAGMVPVPLMAPVAKEASKQSRRASAVMSDCRPRLCIVQDEVAALRIGTEVPALTLAVMLAPAPKLAWRAIAVDSCAFLQYTSGSTSVPRGVVVSHRNLYVNSNQIAAAFDTDSETIFASWLPLFHDMGMIGKALHPLYLGATAVFLRPETFLRHPRRWLRLISEFRVVAATAPNFAFDYCVDRVAADPDLDLSSWRVALNGSEPVRAETLDRFSEKFSVLGFRREVFQPTYGLAEATLLVSSRGTKNPINEVPVALAGLAEGIARPALVEGEQVKRIVSVGRAWHGTVIKVWRTEEHREASDLEVGEILVAGDNVCSAYFDKPELSQGTFRFRIPGDERNYLRTGDLGFLRDGELYITGRRKELIILRGRNYYPQDVEDAAQSASSEFVADGGAAFDIESEGQQRVVLVQELRRGSRTAEELESLRGAAATAVADQVGLALFTVIFVERGELPKTTSGKIARSKTRSLFHSGAFGSPSGSAHKDLPNADEIVRWWRATAPAIDGRTMDERRCIFPHLVLELGNRGLLGLCAPASAGGLGLGVGEATRVIREVASVDLTLAAFLGVHNGLAIDPLLKFGSESQKQTYLPMLASGRMLGAFALTEKAAGSNLRNIRATARREGGGWVLDGNKTWIGTAAWSGLMVFIAQTYDNDGTYLGMSAFLLPSATPGVRQGRETLTLGMRAMIQNDVHVEGAWVGDSSLLGRVGHGYDVAQSTVTFGRLGVAAMSLGCMQRLVQWLSEYAQVREISSGKLAANPHAAGEIFKIQAATLAIGAMTDRCCQLLDNGELVPLEVLSALKAIASELCWNAVDRALQLFGGRGYDEENAIAQMLRDARLLRIFEGPSETLFGHVGHALEIREQGLLEFLEAGFPAAKDACDSMRLEIARLRELCRESGKGAEKALQVGLGHAAGYLMLEAAFLAHPHVAGDSKLAHCGSRWLRGCRERLLQDCAEGMAAPWMHGDFSPLESAAGAIRGLTGSWMPAALKADIEEQRRRGAWREDPRPEATAQPPAIGSPRPTPVLATTASRTLQREVAGWIGNWIQSRLSSPGSIPVDQGFVELGLDSIDAIELLAAFGECHGIEVDASVLWEFPNLRALSEHLASLLERQSRAAGEEAEPMGEVAAGAGVDDFELLLEQELKQ